MKLQTDVKRFGQIVVTDSGAFDDGIDIRNWLLSCAYDLDELKYQINNNLRITIDTYLLESLISFLEYLQVEVIEE